MMQLWTPDGVRFMRDASEYGDYYPRLVTEILPHLPKDGHICDAGCGLGYLAEELAKHCANVTGIDRSVAAIGEMNRRNSAARGICADIFEVSEPFDAMVFCYFGRTEEILRLAKKLCKGSVVVIKRDCGEHTFSLGSVEHKKHTVEYTLADFSAHGIPYLSKKLSLEMGQPFRSLGDAVAFYRLYDKSGVKITEDMVAERLVSTGREDFPLYLPSKRQMEMVVFSAKDIPEGSILR